MLAQPLVHTDWFTQAVVPSMDGPHDPKILASRATVEPGFFQTSGRCRWAPTSFICFRPLPPRVPIPSPTSWTPTQGVILAYLTPHWEPGSSSDPPDPSSCATILAVGLGPGLSLLQARLTLGYNRLKIREGTDFEGLHGRSKLTACRQLGASFTVYLLFWRFDKG